MEGIKMTSFAKAREAAASALKTKPCRDFFDVNGELDELRRREAVDAALSAFEEAGFVLVPCLHDGKAGLTHEMCDAFWRRHAEAAEKHGHYESTNAAYNAMIAAAIAERQK